MTEARAPHLLYVAWGYPPSRGAGMYRALATANVFAEAGWRVTVLTAEREVFTRLTDVDPDSEASIDPRIDVRRLQFPMPQLETDIARWSWLRAQTPLGWNGLQLLTATLRFPERRYGSWRTNLVAEALAVHDESPVDLVIGTANPHVDFAPGWTLHRRFGIPFVMDYRDTWHLDMYSGRRIGSRRSRSARWEARALRRAAEVWFVNDPIRRWHVEEHPVIADRAHVVSNGYDEDFLKGFAPRRRGADDPLSIGYLGTVYGPMPLREVFEGWRLARERSAALRRATLDIHGRLGHFATPDSAAKAVIDEFHSDGVRFHGRVSKTKVAATYSGMDALALILGRSRFITSGKVFEYVATGLPIVALHHPETASTSVLEDYPLAALAQDDTAEAFADAFLELEAIIDRATPEDRRRALSVAARWERRAQLEPRLATLRRLVEARR